MCVVSLYIRLVLMTFMFQGKCYLLESYWILECVELGQTVLYKEPMVTLNNTTLVEIEFHRVSLDLAHFYQCMSSQFQLNKRR